MSRETEIASAPSAALLAQHTLNPVQIHFLACHARFSCSVGGVGGGQLGKLGVYGQHAV